MPAFLEDVFNSIFEPNAENPSSRKAINASFYCLFLCLIGLYGLTRSMHALILLAIAIGLFASLRWY